MGDSIICGQFNESAERKLVGMASNNVCGAWVRLSLPGIAALLLTLFLSFPAQATQYECQTKQAMWWLYGKIEPYIDSPGHKASRHAIIHFDDETGVMVWQFDRHSVEVKTKFEIVRKEAPPNNMVAIKRYEERGAFDGFSLFEIYRPSQNSKKSYFLKYAAPGGEIVSGSCNVITK